MKLMIICSTSFYNKLQPIIDKLECLGHELLLPNQYDGVNNEHHYEKLTDEEYIEYSRNIVSYLNKSLFKDIEGEAGEPIVTIKYTDKKGNVTELAANETVLFYEGEAYRIQQDGMFVTIAEGLFFPELADISMLVPQ